MKIVVTLTVNPAIDTSTGTGGVVNNKKMRCVRPRYEPGGGGVNVSRAMDRLGGTSISMFFRGGMNGEVFEDLLDQDGVNHHAINIKNEMRRNISVMDTANNQQYRFVMPGPRVRKSEWQNCLDQITSFEPRPDYIVASGSLCPGMPDDFYRRVADIASSTKTRLVVDSSGPPLKKALGPGLFLIKPNMGEFNGLLNREISNEEELQTAALQLIKKKRCEVIIVSLGSAGAFVASRGYTACVRAPTVNIKSKVGAGDSMMAGLVYGLARGDTLEQAVRLGVAAGAAAVMTPGSELCGRADTYRLYEILQQRPGGSE